MTDRDPPRDEDEALLAEYALGLLPEAEAAPLARRIAADPTLAARLRAWQEDLAGLAEGLDDVAPPPRVKAAIDRAAHGAVPRRGLLGWLGAGVVAAGLAGVVLVREWPLLRHRVALTASDSGAVYDIALDLRARRLTAELREGAPRPGRDAELWWIAPGGQPISLGVMPHAGAVRRELPDAVPADPAAPGGVTLALSDEPAGGSPTGQPTGPVVASDTLTTL